MVLTAGPTFEPIDDVRGITNRSSGRQGFEIARAARDAGADVTLIAGPTTLPTPYGIKRINTVTARDMLEAVTQTLDTNGADIFIGVAAVADWRVANAKEGKMKKIDGRLPELQFEENPDILRTVGERSDVAVKIGFAAEATNLENYARGKCNSKHADLIVGNIARQALGSDQNDVLFVTPDNAESFGPAEKHVVAEEIIRRAALILNTKETH